MKLKARPADIQPAKHSAKSIQIRSFFRSLFSRISTEFRDLLSKTLYSVQKRENTDQKKLCSWTLLHSERFWFYSNIFPRSTLSKTP